MPREITLDPKTVLNSDFEIRGISDAGESVRIPIESLSAYTSASQSFAIYDGADGAVPFSQTSTDGTTFPEVVRLEFGDLTDETYFPYGAIMNNQESAPAASVFDFRLLELGTFLQFDVEFKAYTHVVGSGLRINQDFTLYMDFTYPNGDVERRTVSLPSNYIDATSKITHNIKLSFSTYIKTALTDKLMGGKIEYGLMDNLAGVDDQLVVSNLIVRAKL